MSQNKNPIFKNSGETDSFYGAPRTKSKYSIPPLRPRINQPTGYRGMKSTTPMMRSVNHDYVYYPVDWTDEGTRKKFKRGYYDENGVYYENVIIRKGNRYETRAACSFCGTELKLKWNEGALPTCPACGAAIHENIDGTVIEEEIQPVVRTVFTHKPNADDKFYGHKTEYNGNNTAFSGGRRESPTYMWFNNGFFPLAIFIVIAVIILFITFAKLGENKNNNKSPKIVALPTMSPEELASYEERMATATNTPTPTPKPTEAPGYCVKFTPKEIFADRLYVEELGRECFKENSKSNEFVTYSDSESGCVFRFNDKRVPSEWQYYFSDISSQFGDYGWMEYNFKENQWYIEAAANNWIKLPDKYDKSKLWHMPGPNDGSYYGRRRIYVNEIERYCDFNEEEGCYYDPKTECHFYYETYTGTGYWVYWFKDLQKEGLHWLKYDNKAKKWYVDNLTRWYDVTGAYNFDKYWHIEQNPSL